MSLVSRTLAAAAVALLATVHAAEPFLVAHRGASHDAPENTLPAFELAWKQGADAIEGDFYLTKDGKIVCLHDKDTQRVSGTKLLPQDSTLAELQALDAGAWFKPEFEGTRMPTLRDVAATVPAGKLFYVEVKCGPEIMPALLEDLAASGLKDEQIVVISFQAPVIAAVRKARPQWKASWLSSFAQESPLNPSLEKVLATLKETGATGFSSKADPRLDEAFVKAVKDAGYEYHCWTVDEVPVAERFLKLGAMSVTTNRPAFIREGLK